MKEDLLINIKNYLKNVPENTYILQKTDILNTKNETSSFTYQMKGKGFTDQYIIFPGITLAYQYFLGEESCFHHDALHTSLEINHCHQGRIGIHMKDNMKVFLGEGDMALQSMDCCADADITLPLGFYEGIMITINLEELKKNPPSFFTSDMNMSQILFDKFCEKSKPVAIPANHRIEHIFCELYNMPDDYKIPYMKLKVIELILFLSQLQLDENLMLNPYLSDQVEIIKSIHKKLTSNLNKRYTIEDLSSEFLINATSLKNIFKSIYGLPIATYMKKYKINASSKMLRESDSSIAQIALDVGYESQGKFTKAFKELIGISPSDFRKQYR